MEMSDVYRRYVEDELSLAEAAALLRSHAPVWNTAAGSLALEKLPDEQRDKAAELLDAAIQPYLEPYLAGQVTSDVAARQLAPLVAPLGVYALNLNLPPGTPADEAMPRLLELLGRLVDLAGQA